MLARSRSSAYSIPPSQRPRWAGKLDLLNSLDLRDRRVARAVYALPWEQFQTPWSPLEPTHLNVLVRMLEALNLTGTERVLDIGTGTGHRAALLGSLATQVWSVEISEAVASSARQRLRQAGCKNVQVVTADGSL